ncbi:MAG: DUF6492 family protein, partial [Thermotogota bacterium]|nr:DUF6492 family protein [Thermotogota bacterium]
MEQKTKKIILFCKSYSKDMFRARRMAESVHRFNADNIPLYVSVPASDLNQFKQCFENIPCHFITDEEILNKSRQVYGQLPRLFPSHLLQQLIKLEFWRMGLCSNYVWLDSDSYFIKPFEIKDFFYDEETPYTICHKSKELRRFSLRYNKKIIEDFEKLAKKFQKMFNRSGPYYNFGYAPIIWSCRVLESLYEDYAKPNNKSIYEILYQYPCEMQLYGEYLLYSKTIPIVPIEPIFKVFHYAEQFFESQMRGESEFSLSEEFFGIVMQSNWTLIRKKKKTSIRLKKNFRKLLRQLH